MQYNPQPACNNMQYSTSPQPAGHHLRRSGYAANPGQGTFPNGSPLPKQRTLPSMWSAAPASAAASIPAQSEVEREKARAQAYDNWELFLETHKRRARSEAQVAVLADMSDRLLYQFEKQLDQQDAINIALAQYVCPSCGKTNLSATLVPPIGAGLGCGCSYHTPIDLD